jgi:hypothetical protein
MERKFSFDMDSQEDIAKSKEGKAEGDDEIDIASSRWVAGQYHPPTAEHQQYSNREQMSMDKDRLSVEIIPSRDVVSSKRYYSLDDDSPQEKYPMEKDVPTETRPVLESDPSRIELLTDIER